MKLKKVIINTINIKLIFIILFGSIWFILKDLFEGKISVADVPKIWDAKMLEYLGVTVPNNGKGALQDVHWSCGYFGYFPTYSLG